MCTRWRSPLALVTCHVPNVWLAVSATRRPNSVSISTRQFSVAYSVKRNKTQTNEVNSYHIGLQCPNYCVVRLSFLSSLTLVIQSKARGVFYVPFRWCSRRSFVLVRPFPCYDLHTTGTQWINNEFSRSELRIIVCHRLRIHKYLPSYVSSCQ